MPRDKETIEEKLLRLIKQARKAKDDEAVRYYSQCYQSKVRALVSFERFKGSWAYEMWKGNPKGS